MKSHRQNDTSPLGNDNDSVAEDGSPVRQCAVTRERLAQTHMVRFACAPDTTVTPDVSQRLPGRGVWVTANRATIDQAVKTNAFARGFKKPVKTPEDLSDTIESLLVKRCVGILGMAKKAGEVVLGFNQVREELRKGQFGLLLEASDGSKDGRGKLYFLAKAIYDDVNMAGALTSTELGMAFGREHVIHGLVREGSFTTNWAGAYQRLTGFREAPERTWFKDREN